MHAKLTIIFSILFFSLSCNTGTHGEITPRLIVSENRRFLATETGDPFFWLGDTGWLLPSKLNREEAEVYLEDRRQKGFNVIQVSVLHNIRSAVNFYGDTALIGHQIDKPRTTPGNSYKDPEQYDYWDHLDYIVDIAGSKGIYIGIVMLWGSGVRSGLVTADQAKKYGEWIASRYKNRTNVIWINGGDVRGDDSTSVWNALGTAVRRVSPDQLITYHPFGRTQSSKWFHNESWLDFNMFQSGHRRYDQDTSGLAYGEDNWRYAADDYFKIPVKPTLDGEPSYEGIPQGLHDTTQPYWTDMEVRRYAYWSVFAGCCGFTYGDNAVMQFYKPDDSRPAYGAKEYWDVAINAPGASQMRYLKQLMLSKPYFERVPANDLLAEKQGEKYDYLAVTRGVDYVFVYTWNGSNISLDLQKMPGSEYKTSWFDPRTGSYTLFGTYKNKGVLIFDPPGEKETGNDWVLILEKI
ncbi:MAG: glycoside hydrolase family 140 protein [Bacteroidales bacterium]|nr:glycoside hydrolase family 140 protein [Bacteroidales bacterium]